MPGSMGPTYVLDKSAKPGGALSQFTFVKFTDQETVNTAGAGQRAIGVAQEEISADDATRGRVADIRVLGISYVVAGGAITAGALVTSNASGRAVTAAVGNIPAGVALQAAAADGDPIAVLLTPGAQPTPA